MEEDRAWRIEKMGCQSGVSPVAIFLMFRLLAAIALAGAASSGCDQDREVDRKPPLGSVGPQAAEADKNIVHRDAAPSGCQPLAAGVFDRKLSFRGIERTYRLYIPKSLDRGRRAPLVIVLHGGGGSGRRMEAVTLGSFNRLAEKDGFLVVYPDGIDRHWNDGRRGTGYKAHVDNVDDVGFIGALIDAMVGELGADPDRVYATGASNGALMCYRLAIESPGRLAAVAPVMCPLNVEYADASPPEKMPILMIMGTEDPLAPFKGGRIGFPFGRSVGEAISFERTVAFWVRHNNASAEPVVYDLPDADPRDGARARREVYAAREGGAEVVVYTVAGGGHTWPGGYQYLSEQLIGRTCRDFDAASVIWEFFKKHSRRKSG
jgi:polyhydroxybutyrate depolymerase